MKGVVEDRAVQLGQYIADNGATVRQTAKVFHISKSTVHKDVTVHLPKINKALAKSVAEVLTVNKAERHIRGGMATKRNIYQKNNSLQKDK